MPGAWLGGGGGSGELQGACSRSQASGAPLALRLRLKPHSLGSVGLVTDPQGQGLAGWARKGTKAHQEKWGARLQSFVTKILQYFPARPAAPRLNLWEAVAQLGGMQLNDGSGKPLSRATVSRAHSEDTARPRSSAQLGEHLSRGGGGGFPEALPL